MVAIVDTAPQLARDSAGALKRRVVSALALAPAAIAAVWFGGVFLVTLTTVAGGLMGWEWARLCGHGRIDARGIAIIAAVIAGTLAVAVDKPILALGLLGGGALLAGALGRHAGGLATAVVGVVWIGLPCVAFLWLAKDAATGRTTVFLILAVVWATDIGAYVAGRSIGGPRLAPRISPNKTWSGLLGGILCAMIAGTGTAIAFGAPIRLSLPLLSGLLGVVAQIGDLAESFAKRRFGVKDSSGLIPGHGGLLDRLDGLLTVIPAVAFLNLVDGGSVVAGR